MAQNEMRAKPALPERVRSIEGLGVWLLDITEVIRNTKMIGLVPFKLSEQAEHVPVRELKHARFAWQLEDSFNLGAT